LIISGAVFCSPNKQLIIQTNKTNKLERKATMQTTKTGFVFPHAPQNSVSRKFDLDFFATWPAKKKKQPKTKKKKTPKNATMKRVAKAGIAAIVATALWTAAITGSLGAVSGPQYEVLRAVRISFFFQFFFTNYFSPR
jgi:hypothetical protein